MERYLLFGNFSPELLFANLVILFFGMGIHEYAHSLVAFQMGDPTPKEMGRLTPNPIVHINWIGWLMFAFIGFGILGSAPISPWRMRNPRYGYLAAVAAGPLSNLLMAIGFALVIRLVGGLETLIGMPTVLQLLLIQGVTLNVLLFVFNLIPLFPFDGWHIVYTLLPPDLATSWERNRQMSQYIFFGALFISFAIPSFSPFGIVIGRPVNLIASMLLGF